MATELTNVTGLKELDAILKTLPAKVEGNVMAGALRAGQTVFLKGAAAELQAAGAVDTGELLRSLRIRLQTRSKRFGWVRVSLKAGGKTAPHAHLVEFGTASYYTGSGRSVRKPYKIKPKKGNKLGALAFGGKVVEEVTHPGARPVPFMRRSVDKHQQAALDATMTYLRKRIPKEVTKAGM